MKEINLEIITPAKSVYKGTIKSINIPGTLGNFQVLFNHAPLLSTFEIGRIKIVDAEDKTIEYATGGGTVEVRNNVVTVLANSAETQEDIDINRAKESYNRAKSRLAQENRGDIDVLRAETALQRAINRMKMVGVSY